MKKHSLIVATSIIAMFTACQEDVITPSVSESVITKTEIDYCETIPYESKSVLESFSADAEVLDYNLARKLTIAEFTGTGMDEELGWKGCKLNEAPVVIYGFDNKPKFYDFIVVDAENRTIGTITSYARRKSSTMIKSVTHGVKNYTGQLAKSNGSSLFMDWAGTEYVGVRGKSGDAPISAVDSETGEPAEYTTEITDEEIIEILKQELLPALVLNDYSAIPEEILNDSLIDELEAIKNISVDALVDSLKNSLADNIENTEAFWADMDGLIEEVDGLSDDELIDESGKGLKIIRRIFSKVDRDITYIQRYNNRNYVVKNTSSLACGPWVCGFIYYIKYGVDKYKYFYDCASTVGEFGLANVGMRLMNQRAMTPAEMSWSMKKITNGTITIDPKLVFNDFSAYDQIHHYDSPAIRLCKSGNSLHWMLAFGTYQSGNYAWRNYYFVFRDNQTHGDYIDPTTKGDDYSQVDWWNPWLMVWD